MQTLISGVNEDVARSLIDEQAWRGAEACWVDPDELVQSVNAGTRRTNNTVVWLYRSPMTELLSASEHGVGDVKGVLDRWWSHNHAALELERRGNGRWTLLNVDRLRCSGWPGGIFGPDANPAGHVDGGGADEVTERILQRVIEPDFPEHIELFELLEAASRLPDGEEPWFREADGETTPAELSRMLDALVSVPGLLRRIAEVDAQVGQLQHELAGEHQQVTSWMRENELLLLQLRTLQEDARHELASDRKQIASCLRESGMLNARIDEYKLQVKVLRKSLEHYFALLGGEERHDLRVRLAGMLAPAESLRLARSARRNRIDELRNSTWFDADWYAGKYSDIKGQGADPVTHYHDWGWLEGRDPGPRFSTTYYLQEYPDVTESGLNPLWHFIRYGEQEGRSPAPAISR